VRTTHACPTLPSLVCCASQRWYYACFTCTDTLLHACCPTCPFPCSDDHLAPSRCYLDIEQYLIVDRDDYGVMDPTWRITHEAMRYYVAAMTTCVSRCHAAGITHRDLKPANYLLDGLGRVRLCDFGLCAHAMRLPPAPYSMAGTPLYISPELYALEAVEDQKQAAALHTLLPEWFDLARHDTWSLGASILALFLYDDGDVLDDVDDACSQEAFRQLGSLQAGLADAAAGGATSPAGVEQQPSQQAASSSSSSSTAAACPSGSLSTPTTTSPAVQHLDLPRVVLPACLPQQLRDLLSQHVFVPVHLRWSPTQMLAHEYFAGLDLEALMQEPGPHVHRLTKEAQPSKGRSRRRAA
jgi:serine/threonine protein kinase